MVGPYYNSVCLQTLLDPLPIHCLYTVPLMLASVCIPQGFGATAKSTQDCRRADPSTIVVFHQADTGEYLRNEDTLT